MRLHRGPAALHCVMFEVLFFVVFFFGGGGGGGSRVWSLQQDWKVF